MKIISWNVNGIRAVLKKGFVDFVKKSKADIICLQETKAPADRSLKLNIDGYQEFWNYAQKAGYSGTAVLTKIKPINVVNDMGVQEHDQEGRVITLEFKDFYLVNVYVPNSKRELERLPYRQQWDKDFLAYLKKLEKKKAVVFCGDLNVAHKEIDLTYPKANERNHGFTKEERAGFDAFVDAGFIDTFREFVKDGGHYSWWSPMGNCRAKDIGWRIDYFCVSSVFGKRLKAGHILKDVMGSDHCPVELEIK